MTLDIATCPHHWVRVASDTLPSAINVACENIPIQNYVINKVGRYVKFTAVNFHGSGSTLQYLHVNTDYPNGIMSENDYICPSKIIDHLQYIPFLL